MYLNWILELASQFVVNLIGQWINVNLNLHNAEPAQNAVKGLSEGPLLFGAFSNVKSCCIAYR